MICVLTSTLENAWSIEMSASDVTSPMINMVSPPSMVARIATASWASTSINEPE